MVAVTESAARSTSSLSSVRNAARVLKEFGHDSPEIGVTEIARRLGIGKSTAHRLLNTLAEERLLEQNPANGAYRLGLAIYQLGATVTVQAEIHAAAGPVLEHLSSATRETTMVVVLDGAEVVCVDRRESPQSLRLGMKVGSREDAHVTSAGKLLMAFLPDEQRERLLTSRPLRRATQFTLTDPAVLRTQLDEVASRGWADNINESEVGVSGIAAPIRNVHGAVIAAISVLGPSQRMTPQVVRRLARPTMEAGVAISRRLGHREQPEAR